MEKKINVIAGILNNETKEILCALRLSCYEITKSMGFTSGKFPNSGTKKKSTEIQLFSCLFC